MDVRALTPPTRLLERPYFSSPSSMASAPCAMATSGNAESGSLSAPAARLGLSTVGALGAGGTEQTHSVAIRWQAPHRVRPASGSVAVSVGLIAHLLSRRASRRRTGPLRATRVHCGAWHGVRAGGGATGHGGWRSPRLRVRR